MVRTRARASRILIKQGKAVGARLSDGEEISVGELVASTVDPQTLVVDLLSKAAVGEEMTRKIERYEWGDSIMVIYLALSGPLEFKAGEETARACYVHCTPPALEYIARLFVEVRAGLLLARPVMVVCNDYTADPSRVPPGKGLIKILVKCVPYKIEGDARNKIATRNWETAKDPFADRVINLLAEHSIPNLQARILKRIVSFTGGPGAQNHYGCAWHRTARRVRSVSDWRDATHPELGQYRTPVPNVYLCGPANYPGPGVSFMPGRNAARVILSDLGLDFERAV